MAEKMDTDGLTNLHHAVAERFTNLVHSILERGEETVNMTDRQGRTPLHLACSNIEGKEEKNETKVCSSGIPSDSGQIIELLLAYGADPQICDKTGKPPLHCLIDHWLTNRYPLGETLMRVITQFLHYGGINGKDVNGRTPLHYVAGSPDIKVPGIEEVVYVPTIISERDIPKYTPEDQLYMKEFAVKLLTYGADINAADNEGNAPLHLAISANKFDIVKELLARKPNVNIKNNMGQTPLHHAVSDKEKFNHCGILLLHKGALASIADVKGCTPVDISKNKVYFPCFLKHLILLMKVRMHPEMKIKFVRRRAIEQQYKSIKRACKRECNLLNAYFNLRGQSQLPLILRTHSLPVYTENDFFQTKLNREEFRKTFPNYSLFLKYKFLQDKNRRKMIERCKAIFSCFGGDIQYSKGRLVYNRYSHWENMPEELKLLILSYLRNEDLEYLEKHLF